MIQKTTLPLFHFLFCELIQEVYNNHKEDDYLGKLKNIGNDIGFRLFNIISIKKQMNERQTSISNLIKIIQTKVFKYLFNYEAASVYTASDQVSENQKFYYHVIIDNISIYLTWIPEHLWDTSIIIAGIIQSILKCGGLQCNVTCSSKIQGTETPQTQFFVKITQAQNQKWKQNQ